jgi:anaerobic selenocysteine-containing dehydrogenase
MQIFRYAEQGSIKLLWISATNPAVSLPDLPRIRRILADDKLFLVVQDMYLTETGELADVVLPAAGWGEKLGTFTNADRTVHISEKAAEPPGTARSDLEIFVDFAQRMDFRDRAGQPLITWAEPEAAFTAWQRCSAGRPCDYTGLSYAKLREGSGIQWPCDDEHPDGTERLYTDGRFPTEPERAETYGQDLTTGAEHTVAEYRALQADGRAFLHAAEYQPSPEVPSPDYPLQLTTGRIIYHFHTRTRTGRAPELNDAAPGPWVEVSAQDAREYGIGEGDLVQVDSARGAIQVPAMITDIRPGLVFIPFHYGDGEPEPTKNGHRAANELTRTGWDPVSKQPMFKVAAVRISKVGTHASDPLPRIPAAH